MFVSQTLGSVNSAVPPAPVADISEARAKAAAAAANAEPTEAGAGNQKKPAEPSVELRFTEFVKSDPNIRIGGRVQQTDEIDPSWFRWNDSHWQILKDMEARKIALGYLKRRDHGRFSKASARSLVETATDYMLDEHDQELSVLEAARDRDDALVPVEGAYLRIKKDGTIHPLKPTRELGITYTVPAAFDWTLVKDGVYTPLPVDPESLWGRWLDLFMPDHGVRCLLQEAVAASILPVNFEKAFVLSGTGSNGKSTLLHLLRFIHPHFTSLRLDKASGQFGFQNIAGKTLIIASEVPKFIGNDAEQCLKSLISRDPIEVEKKNKDSYSIVPRTTLFLAINSALCFTDHTYGSERKYLIIPFLVCMPENSKDRVEDYSGLITNNPKEMSVFLDWILEGAARLRRQGNKFSALPESAVAYANEAKKETCSVVAYLQDADARFDADVWTPKMDIFTAYKGYCQERGTQAKSHSPFWTQVRAIFERKQQLIGDKLLSENRQKIRERGVHLRVDGVPIHSGKAP